MGSSTLVPEYTDLANAQRFIADHGSTVRYCSAKGKWLVWDANRWRWDDVEKVVALAQETVQTMVAEAMKNENFKQRFGDAKHAISSGSRSRIDAMLFLARPHLAVRPDQLDADPMVFNVLNGTLDLATGDLMAHDPAHLITKLSPVSYDPGATCPLWIKFLNDITSGDQELIGYLQRAAGYSLTGKVQEHVLFMLYGLGLNGKTTFVEALRHVFGDYARTSAFETFMQQASPSAPRNDLAMLCGARFVTATESEDGNQLAESFVKQITGGDKVTARFLYGEHFEFVPSFKLWLLTNHKPTIKGTDDGIWRRIRLIPFTVRIANDRIDRQLPDNLKTEGAGVLVWMVEGWKQYQIHGLSEPASVWRATAEYRSDEDPIGRFLQGACSTQPLARVQSRLLYKAFRSWAGQNGERVMDERKFSKAMASRGYKSTRGSAGVFWLDISLPELWGDSSVVCRVV